MSFQATVYNVMIASPGDVQEEREMVRKIIYEWNAVHADERKIVLLPVGWETHATPETTGHPQQSINRQVLEPSDLLVGIFWSRIGTPTQDFVSGAVEEIERHVANGKPAMLYFSQKPIEPSKLDKKQFKEIEKFKKKYQSQSLYWEFNSLSDFEKKFSNHLQLKLKENYFNSNPTKNVVVDKPEETKRPMISNEALSLLKAASLDNQGVIHRIPLNGRLEIQTNRRSFVEDNTPRTRAKWEAVIKQLLDEDYIVASGNKGQTFRIVEKGFQLAETVDYDETTE